MSRIEGVDLLAPGGEGCELVLDRALAVCDVVDLAAERVDRIHPVSAMVWQETHCPVERRPRRLDPMPNRFEYRRITELAADGAERGVVHPRPNPVTTVATAATKSDVRSLTRVAKGSPSRSRRSKCTASATITALSRRSPEDAARLTEQFNRWAANDARFQTIADGNALLVELKPLSKDLAALGQTGLKALEYLSTGQPPPAEWLAAQQKEIARMQRPPAVELNLAATRPVKVLLDELAKPGR